MSECLKLHISQVFKDEVAKNGFNHVSVAKIMKQSGIRRQTFYENFKDKFDLLDYTIKSMMKNDIESNIGYLDWEGIIFLVFYGIELNKKFYKSVYESQTEVDVVGEISSHIAVLLKQIIEEEGADFDQQAKAVSVCVMTVQGSTLILKLIQAFNSLVSGSLEPSPVIVAYIL